jgi:hypothetical protein
MSSHPYQAIAKRAKARNAPPPPTRKLLEPGKSEATPTVVFTEEERKLIAEAAYQIYKDAPDISREIALQRAAEQNLPADRQKKIVYPNVTHWVIPHWTRLDEERGQQLLSENRSVVARLRALAEAPEQVTPPTVEPTEPTEPTAMAEALTAAVKEAEAPELLETPTVEAQTEPEPEPEPTAVPLLEKIPTEQVEAMAKVARKVFWKPDEIEKVALETARLLATDIEGNLSDLNAVRQAQIAVLEEDRRRDLNAAHKCQTVIDRAIELIPVVKRNMARKALEEREAREAEERMQAAEAERIEREALEARAHEQATHDIEEMRKRTEAEAIRTRAQTEAFSAAVATEVSKTLDAAPYGLLIGALAKKVMGDFMGSMIAEIRADMKTMVHTELKAELLAAIEAIPKAQAAPQVVQLAQGAHVPTDAHSLTLAPKDHMPKVVVVGLTYQQFDELKKGFFGVAELELIKTQAGGMNGGNAGANMLSAANRADVVIAMLDHVGLDVKAAGLKCPVPFIKINGAVSGARRWIRQWLNGEISLAA